MNLITIPITFFKGYINKGHNRSVKAKKNIIFSFFIKGISMALGFLLLPLTINYVNTTQYGIWITLSSIIGWFSLFDIGFGHGLRNKFAEAVAKGEDELARIYVSTTYAILIIIICATLILFFCINPFLNWSKILNTSAFMAAELRLLALVVFVCFCIHMILKLIVTILTANQQPAKASFINFLTTLSSFIIILVLIKTTKGSLFYLSLTYSITPVLVLAIASITCFANDYYIYRPSIKYVRFSFAKNLMNLGVKFFIIQIGALILLQTDNIIIIHLFDSKEVTVFNTAFKLFSTIVVVFSLIMAPLWSAFTDAYTKKDFKWIRRLFNKMQMICLLLLLPTLLLLFFSPLIFDLWVGNKVRIPFSLSIAMAIYAILSSWLFIPCSFLNGTGKIKLQLYLYLICILSNVPLGIFLGKSYGLPGVAVADIFIFVCMNIVLTIQCNKIINNTAEGIWAK